MWSPWRAGDLNFCRLGVSYWCLVGNCFWYGWRINNT